jgi:hypothetical protein
MFRWLKRLAVPVASLALFGIMSVSAKADTVVQYYTVGQFDTGFTAQSGFTATVMNGPTIPLSGPGYGDTDKSSITIKNNSTSKFSTVTFDYSGLQQVTLAYDPISGTLMSNGDFGAFEKVVTTDDNFDSFEGLGFTLTFYQVAPPASPPSANILATVHGQVRVSTNQLKVFFSPSSVFVPPNDANGIKYTIDMPSNGYSLKSNQMVTIQGDVSAAPLPATANIGLSLLGGVAVLGGLKKLRDRRMGLTA